MPDILHKVGIKSSTPTAVYRALTTLDGLAAWWTTDTQGESKIGGMLRFRFGDGGFDMKVLELDPGRRVLWEVVDGPEEWIGTRISFEIADRALRVLRATPAKIRSFFADPKLAYIRRAYT